MARPRFEVSVSARGQHTFKLMAATGEVILAGKQYHSRAELESGLACVRANAPIEQRYARRESQAAEHYFLLEAANREVIGASQLYSSRVAMERAIESLKANAPTAPIETEAPTSSPMQLVEAHAWIGR